MQLNRPSRWARVLYRWAFLQEMNEQAILRRGGQVHQVLVVMKKIAWG